jgi:hypothetical protein
MTIFCVARRSSLGVAMVPGCLRRPHSRFCTESLLGENFSICARTRQYYGYAIFGGRKSDARHAVHCYSEDTSEILWRAHTSHSTMSSQGCVAFSVHAK